MLKKREKKSYGAYIDYFLEECVVSERPFDTTHIHITKSNKFVPGIYDYEPKTGVLVQEEQHIGILRMQEAVKWSSGKDMFNSCVFLKHRPTWEEMIEKGIVKGDIEEKDSNTKTPLGIPIKSKNNPIKKLGFLKKILGNNP